MSLYGALFGGVSGLGAQGSKIAIISDNIANVNTVGYKQSQALFETLVINSASTVRYQTGGVRAESRMLVDQQGLLLSTNAPTDLAISGAGFFTVNAQIDGSGQPLYTRAGSFRQDSLGNFVNAQGFYLQGWPLDREGRLPGEPGNLNQIAAANLDSLQTVNIESASGVAQATTVISIGANLDAGQSVFPGQGGIINMDSNDTNNFGISSTDIISSAEYGLSPTNGIYRGDVFRVVAGGNQEYDYTYGGYTVGRDVATTGGTNNFGDARNDTALNATLVAGDIVTGAANTGTVTVDLTASLGNVNNILIGDTLNFAAVGTVDGIDFDATTFTVQAVDTATDQITLSFPNPLANLPTVGGDATGAGTLNLRQYSGNIFDATSAGGVFFNPSTTPLNEFDPAALSFTISSGGDTFTFTYASSPNTLSGQFNSLSTLATAIDEVGGLSARVVNNRLLVGAEDATQAITFANGNTNGVAGTSRGIDWVGELSLTDVSASLRRFNSLGSLANLVNGDDGISAVVENPLANTRLTIRVDDPLATIEFQDAGQPLEFPIGTTVTIPAVAQNTAVQLDFDLGIPVPADFLVGDEINLQNLGVELATAINTAFGTGFNGNTPPNTIFTVAAVAGNILSIVVPGTLNTAVAGTTATVSAASTAITGTVSGNVPDAERNQGSLLATFGLTPSLDGVGFGNLTQANQLPVANPNPVTTGELGPVYAPAGGPPGSNMASGDITAQFSRNIRIFDALGAGHDVRVSVIKVDENRWATEVHAIPETDVSSPLPDGLVSFGFIEFNGDGSLRSIDPALTDPIEIAWTNGAVASNITIDWGTAGLPFGTPGAAVIGDTDGLSQFDSSYNVAFTEQNGAPVGQLVGVSIDGEGFVIASYSNGETQALYQLPIADFANPNGLRAISGNVFAETQDSGVVNLREAGTNGVGDVVAAALEQSNVELSEQLTDLIVAQRAYQSNTRVISATDELLQELNQL